MIDYKCQSCGEPVQAPNSLAGQDDKCPSCGALCRIPSPSAPQVLPQAHPPMVPPAMHPQPPAAALRPRAPRFWGLLIVGILAILVVHTASSSRQRRSTTLPRRSGSRGYCRGSRL